MSTDCKARFVVKCAVLIALAGCILPQSAYAQNYGSDRTVKVTKANTKLTLMANESRMLTLDHDVPHVVVGNQEIVRATPVSPNQILLTAIKPGVTAISISDPENNSKTVDLHVVGDVRQLQAHLDVLFPEASVTAHAINTSIILKGHVNREAEVPMVMQVARIFSQDVINSMTVGGAQKIALQCKVVEVSRTKLRKAGIDWTLITSDFDVINRINGVGANLQFNILDGTNQFNALIEVLEQNNLAKILAEPTVVTRSGRAASFLSGGEVPVPINTGLGVQSVEFQPFGTRLDFVPISLGNGKIQLEVRPEVRELAGDLRDPVTGAPGFRTRRVDTGVEMRIGQTLALAGLIQNRVDSNVKGTPILMDMPWIGAAFRRVEETFNEVELVVLITPYFINEVDGSILPVGPGRQSMPNDVEFYGDGYLEVPNCNGPYELPQMIQGNYRQGNQGQVVPQVQGAYNQMLRPINSKTETPQNLQQPVSQNPNSVYQLPGNSTEPVPATNAGYQQPKVDSNLINDSVKREFYNTQGPSR